MIHLITVVGQHAKDFYLEEHCISDFKSLIRTVTSGRVLIISTKFRSDLFYSSEKEENESILKLWALYANTNFSDLNKEGFMTSTGAEESFFEYFHSMNKLSANWYRYRLYKKAFQHTFINDEHNPVATAVVQCDQHLIEQPDIKRSPLIDSSQKVNSKLNKNTMALAMRIINNDTLSN